MFHLISECEQEMELQRVGRMGNDVRDGAGCGDGSEV